MVTRKKRQRPPLVSYEAAVYVERKRSKGRAGARRNVS